jgi:multimeric flavodoxin WrbA
MSAPRLLGIAGSPRRDGSSDRLLDACLAGAEESGATVDRLVVATAGISPCRGCNACSADGRCVVADGMQAAYSLLDAADAIVVASPVYFATVPAVLKALYDRCQPYWARRYVLHQPIVRRRPGALLLAGGGGDPFGDACAATTTRSVFAVLGLDYAHELTVRADRPADVVAQPGELERAREVGAALAADAADRIAAS